jgi:hypothetical protein
VPDVVVAPELLEPVELEPLELELVELVPPELEVLELIGLVAPELEVLELVELVAPELEVLEPVAPELELLAGVLAISTVAVDCAPRLEAPETADSATAKLEALLRAALIGTEIVFAVESPSIHAKVPLVAVYWVPAVAVPFTVV